MAYIQDVQFYNPQVDGYESAFNKELGKDDFLNLLVTQLRFQNPMDPMQDQQFVAQLAQFSQLEQLENMSSALETTTQVDYLMGQTIANTMATTLIGKTVIAEGADFDLTPGEETNLGYNLGTDAAKVQIKVFNESGTLVKSIEINDVQKGNNIYAWDGRNEDGSLLSPGQYSYEVSAKTQSGESVTVAKRVIGSVDSIKYIDGRAYLIVGGYKVDLSTIIEIEQPGTELTGKNS